MKYLLKEQKLKNMLKIMSSQITKILSRFLGSKDQVSCSQGDNGYKTLGFASVFTAFLVLVAGSVGAAAVALGEKMLRNKL